MKRCDHQRGDYHFTEEKLLQENYRSYSGTYWEKRVMAPSCLLYFDRAE
jgi:phytoene desaturase